MVEVLERPRHRTCISTGRGEMSGIISTCLGTSEAILHDYCLTTLAGYELSQERIRGWREKNRNGCKLWNKRSPFPINFLHKANSCIPTNSTWNYPCHKNLQKHKHYFVQAQSSDVFLRTYFVATAFCMDTVTTEFLPRNEVTNENFMPYTLPLIKLCRFLSDLLVSYGGNILNIPVPKTPRKR
jgi:hypothetical protein